MRRSRWKCFWNSFRHPKAKPRISYVTCPTTPTNVWCTAFLQKLRSSPSQHMSLSWARRIHSTISLPFHLRSTLIIFSHLHLRLTSRLFPSDFRIKDPYARLVCPKCATCPSHHTGYDFVTIKFLERVRIMFLVYIYKNWKFSCIKNRQVMKAKRWNFKHVVTVTSYRSGQLHNWTARFGQTKMIHNIQSRTVFINRRALASIIPGCERFSWNLSF